MTLAIPNGLPEETLEALTLVPAAPSTYGEDCEEAVVEAQRDSDDKHRFNHQCYCARPRQT